MRKRLCERRTRTPGRLLYELAVAVVIGVATLFTSKPEQDMHWSIPPTIVVLNLRVPSGGQGDPPASE